VWSGRSRVSSFPARREPEPGRHLVAKEDVVVRTLFGIGLVMAVLAMAPQEAAAGCTTDLVGCFEEAARVENFWYRWAAGIDCELDYIRCVRVRFVGA
jgi:hypothetical protein